jgi:CheY-like chemotaxis protein
VTFQVLVVEDDHALRDVLARGLRECGYLVVTAADGASAMRSVNPDIDSIVLDIGLPAAWAQGSQVAGNTLDQYIAKLDASLSTSEPTTPSRPSEASARAMSHPKSLRGPQPRPREPAPRAG